jgi:hypothetical protein
MKKVFAAAVAVSLAASVGLASQAQAKGCIRGAIAGGIAGHAVHHTWTGAAAGCLAARHYYKEKRLREQQQMRQNGPQPTSQGQGGYH